MYVPGSRQGLHASGAGGPSLNRCVNGSLRPLPSPTTTACGAPVHRQRPPERRPLPYPWARRHLLRLPIAPLSASALSARRPPPSRLHRPFHCVCCRAPSHYHPPGPPLGRSSSPRALVVVSARLVPGRPRHPLLLSCTRCPLNPPCRRRPGTHIRFLTAPAVAYGKASPACVCYHDVHIGTTRKSLAHPGRLAARIEADHAPAHHSSGLYSQTEQ